MDISSSIVTRTCTWYKTADYLVRKVIQFITDSLTWCDQVSVAVQLSSRSMCDCVKGELSRIVYWTVCS